jgi:hypothetical protein
MWRLNGKAQWQLLSLCSSTTTTTYGTRSQYIFSTIARYPHLIDNRAGISPSHAWSSPASLILLYLAFLTSASSIWAALLRTTSYDPESQRPRVADAPGDRRNDEWGSAWLASGASLSSAAHTRIFTGDRRDP